MRCLYREKIYDCGEYLEVNIYPVFAQAIGKRKPKKKPTPEAQKNLNSYNAKQKLVRLVNTNFTSSDIRFDLTYEHEPGTPEDAQKQMQNFLRRLKRYRDKHQLPELKYIAVTEVGERGGRLHHHMILNCGDMPIAVLAELWGLGYTTVKPLQFNEFGVSDLAAYLVKYPILNKRWNASQNLIKPKETQRDGKISAAKVKELHNIGADAKDEYEKLYKGYSFSGVRPIFNDVNGGYYLSVQMQKIKEKGRKRKRE